MVQRRSTRIARQVVFVTVGAVSLLHQSRAFTSLAVVDSQTKTPWPQKYRSSSSLAEKLREEVELVDGSATSTSTPFGEVNRQVVSLLKQEKYGNAKQLILGMSDYLKEDADFSKDELQESCLLVDEAMQAFYRAAFSPPFRGRKAKFRVGLGMDLLHNQLSCSVMAPPYNKIPKPTLLSALKALTGLREGSNGNGLANTNEAYRLLQRLVTGAGVRGVGDRRMKLYESDFNLVLNAYSNIGRMDMAHRVVALQERTPHAPVLSAVAFSILLKGYGRLRDLDNVEMLLHHADVGDVEVDVVFMNSLLDAYINCDKFDRAHALFDLLRNPNISSPYSQDYPNLFSISTLPQPNKRSFNIYLKGLANQGNLPEALQLADEMRTRRLWDHVTTNTLVQAAVNANDFEAAEAILETNTLLDDELANKKGCHPNSEAYTTVMSGFVNNGDLVNAMDLIRTMKDRGVEPNEYTYTCLIGALARAKKINQATKTLEYMKSLGLKVRVVTYNALISGLLHRDRSHDGNDFDRYVDKALSLLKEMMREGIKPNAVTVSVLIDAFGKCDTPRLSQAKALIEKLEGDGLIPSNNIRITTALVQVYGAKGDVEGAMATFRRIQDPDVASINTLLEACVRSDSDGAAALTFDRYFRSDDAIHRPDVISFSIMTKSALKKLDYDGSSETRRYYEEMKYRRKISPDKTLVDTILRSMIEHGRGGTLMAADVRFLASVLRDAERLEWSDGQLEQRKRAVQTIMTGRIVGTWEEESELFGLKGADDYEDQLFKKHGWNKVDSGFMLWGARSDTGRSSNRDSDDFLQSKGWNNVDSGFRIF